MGDVVRTLQRKRTAPKRAVVQEKVAPDAQVAVIVRVKGEKEAGDKINPVRSSLSSFFFSPPRSFSFLSFDRPCDGTSLFLLLITNLLWYRAPPPLHFFSFSSLSFLIATFPLLPLLLPWSSTQDPLTLS